jgi:hypothetical protein
MARIAGLRVLRLANPFVRLVLESRAHPVLSGQLVVLAYRGHRSGREYRIPLRYAESSDGRIVALALSPEGKQWWRSFAAPTPAMLTLRGARIGVRGSATGGERRDEALATYVARHPHSRHAAQDAAVVVFERVHG